MIATAVPPSLEQELCEAIRQRALSRPAYRWIQTPAPVRYSAIATIVTASVIFAFLAWPVPRQQGHADERITIVKLIDLPIARTRPRAPEITGQPTQRTVNRLPHRVTSQGAVQVATPRASPLQLFDAYGLITLPPLPKPDRQQARLQRARELVHRGHNMLHCRQTIFTPEVDEVYETQDAPDFGQVREDFSKRRAALAAAAAAAACDDQWMHRRFKRGAG